jgi:hypothetical protein
VHAGAHGAEQDLDIHRQGRQVRRQQLAISRKSRPCCCSSIVVWSCAISPSRVGLA